MLTAFLNILSSKQCDFNQYFTLTVMPVLKLELFYIIFEDIFVTQVEYALLTKFKLALVELVITSGCSRVKVSLYFTVYVILAHQQTESHSS